jgi:hypothetical protein
MTFLGLPAKVARAAIVVLVALDLVALAAFSLHRTTTTSTTIRPLSQGTAAAPSTPQQTVGTTPTIPLPSGGGSVALPVSDSTGSSKPSTGKHPAKGTHPKTPPTPKPPTSGVPPITAAEIGKCPVKLDKPAQMGGVQSLVPLAPAFGPFSAEAFAAASAYQPELELLGPILAQYPSLAPKVAPLFAPVLKLFATGSNSLFSLISPLYAPHRTEVLVAETKLATFFAPYSKKLAGQPLAGCVVDLEAALVGDTKPGAATPAVTKSAAKSSGLLSALRLG